MGSASARAPYSEERISLGRLWIFAAAGLPVGAFVTTLSVYLPNYYTSHVGLSLTVVGIAFTLIRVLDVFLDPAIGAAMDSTTTRFGRYRPWLVASIPVLMVATYAVYFPSVGVSGLYLTLWLLVLYAGYSMCVLAHAAWGSALVGEYHERNRVFGWMQALGVVGAAAVLLLPVYLQRAAHANSGVPVMGWFLLLAVPITYLMTGLLAREPLRKAPPRQRFALKDYLELLSRPDLVRTLVATLLTTFGPAITAPLYLFFFESARGYTLRQTTLLLLIYILSGLLAPAFWTRIAVRAGKHQTIKIAAVAYAVAQTSLLLLPPARFLPMSVAMFCVGFVASAFSFVLRAMIADISDEVRLETGKDRAAALYALATSVAKIPATVAVGVAYPILALFGFNTVQGATNTSFAMFGLQALYLVPPVATVLLGGVAMFGYTLDEKRHGDIRAALHASEQESQVGGALESLGGELEPAAQLSAGE